ncbi:MAG TPA: hypothetical protein EYO62_03755 [Aquificales bacterium]|nr:hypothetical protein [Aquificales bacterium]HIO41697.1 hypothetical protein [Aquifex sp.]
MNLLIIWGLILILLGIIGIVAPYYFAIGSVVFFGSLLLTAGLMWAFYNLNSRHRGAGGWLKPFILTLTGLLLIFFPEQSLIVIAAFLLLYLLIDAFANLYLAIEYKSRLTSWFLMLLNGIVDLILAGILLYFMGQPKILAQLIGLLIGISLLVDGVFALWFGWRLKLYYEKYKRILEG